MAQATLKAKSIANRITWEVHFKDKGQWAIRLWIAAQLIKLAAWVAWMNVEIVWQEDSDAGA